MSFYKASLILPLLLQSYTFAIGQNEYFGVVLDANSGEHIIFCNLATKGLIMGFQTNIEGHFEFTADADSLLTEAMYTGYPMSIKWIYPGIPPDTIYLKSQGDPGIYIIPYNVPSVRPNYLVNDKIVINEETQIRAYKYILSRIAHRPVCQKFLSLEDSPKFTIENCKVLKLRSNAYSNKITVYNLNTQKQTTYRNRINFNDLEFGIYEVYQSASDLYWFNPSLINKAGTMKNPLNEPVGVIFIE